MKELGTRNKIIGPAILITAALLTPFAMGQSATVDRLTQSELLEKAKLLEPAASAGNGSASTKIAEYPNHFTMIGLRQKDGGAEVHEKYADFFVVVRGQATLTTGGTVEDPKTTSPGEIRGTKVIGGTSMSLHKGDIVHIPANVPHQLLLATGDSFIYFVIKVQEK